MRKSSGDNRFLPRPFPCGPLTVSIPITTTALSVSQHPSARNLLTHHFIKKRIFLRAPR